MPARVLGVAWYRLRDPTSGHNIFSREDGQASDGFRCHIGGLQRCMPAAMALFALCVNSYRRLVRFTAALINIQWGTDNRTAGIQQRMEHSTECPDDAFLGDYPLPRSLGVALELLRAEKG